MQKRTIYRGLVLTALVLAVAGIAFWWRLQFSYVMVTNHSMGPVSNVLVFVGNNQYTLGTINSGHSKTVRVYPDAQNSDVFVSFWKPSLNMQVAPDFAAHLRPDDGDQAHILILRHSTLLWADEDRRVEEAAEESDQEATGILKGD